MKNAVKIAKRPYQVKLDLCLPGLGRMYSDSGLTEQELENAQIKLTNAQIFSRSAGAVKPEDITIDENGVISFEPQFTYFRDVYVVWTQVDEAAPVVPTTAGPVGGGLRLYQGRIDDEPEEESPLTPATPVTPATPEPEPELIIVDDNVVGDAEAEADNLNFQFRTGTCVGTAIGNILESLGAVDDGYEVVQAATLVLDPFGNPLTTPEITSDAGHAPYIVRLTPAQFEAWNNFYKDNPSDTPQIKSILPLIEDSSQYTWNPAYEDDRNAVGKTLENFFAYTGTDYHTGFASDPTTLIRELQMGNKIGVRVDSRLAGAGFRTPEQGAQLSIIDQMLSDIDENTDLSVNSVGNHLLWLTEIDLSDPNNPTVTVNNSQNKVPRKYSLIRFMAATVGAGFMYFASGEKPAPPEGTDFEKNEPRLTKRLKNWGANVIRNVKRINKGGEPGRAAEHIPPESLLREAAGVAQDGASEVIETIVARIVTQPPEILIRTPEIIEYLPEDLQIEIRDYLGQKHIASVQVLMDLGMTQDEAERLLRIVRNIRDVGD